MSDSVTTRTVAHQVPLFLGISRQEYWSGLPCHPPGDLPGPGIEPMSPTLTGRLFTNEPPGSPRVSSSLLKIATSQCPLKVLPLDFIVERIESLGFSMDS